MAGAEIQINTTSGIHLQIYNDFLQFCWILSHTFTKTPSISHLLTVAILFNLNAPGIAASQVRSNTVCSINGTAGRVAGLKRHSSLLLQTFDKASHPDWGGDNAGCIGCIRQLLRTWLQQLPNSKRICSPAAPFPLDSLCGLWERPSFGQRLSSYVVCCRV